MSDQKIHELGIRLSDLERKLDHLYAHLGISPPQRTDDASPRVVELARSGKTIEAIKVYREETGCDLATAKSRVEALIR